MDSSTGGEYIKVTTKLEARDVSGNMYPRLRINVEADNEDESAVLGQCGLAKSNAELLRSLFGEQREFYKTVGVETYGSFGPDSRYFQATSNEGWRKYLIQLIGSEDRTTQLKHINDAIARRIALIAKPSEPATCAFSLGDGTVSSRVITSATIPETFDMRIGDKLFTVTGVKEDKKKTALLDKALAAYEADAIAQLDGYQAEYASNLKGVVTNYEKEVADLKYQLGNVLPALNVPLSCFRHGMHVKPEADRKEYRIYVPYKVRYKYIIEDEKTWKIAKGLQKDYKGQLMIAVDPQWHVKWMFIYDENFEDHFPQWHVSGGHICQGSFEPKMQNIQDAFKVRDDLQTMMEKINIGSLGTRNIDYCEKAIEIKEGIREFRRRRERYYDGESEDEPEFEKHVAKPMESKAWTTQT